MRAAEVVVVVVASTSVPSQDHAAKTMGLHTLVCKNNLPHYYKRRTNIKSRIKSDSPFCTNEYIKLSSLLHNTLPRIRAAAANNHHISECPQINGITRANVSKNKLHQVHHHHNSRAVTMFTTAATILLLVATIASCYGLTQGLDSSYVPANSTTIQASKHIATNPNEQHQFEVKPPDAKERGKFSTLLPFVFLCIYAYGFREEKRRVEMSKRMEGSCEGERERKSHEKA